MQQLISKFGGTSVSSRENWECILAIVRRHIADGFQPVIVCSALSQSSNKLDKLVLQAQTNQHHALLDELILDHVNLARSLAVSFAVIESELAQLKDWLAGFALLQEAPAKIHAQVMSLGELMMSQLGQAFLHQHGIDTTWFDAREALISTPLGMNERLNYLSAHCEARPNLALSERLLASGTKAIITQGFIAANPRGETVLLGRGGSDTSAALLSAVLNATLCEIWTDVPGIYTANPYDLPEARLLKQLNYDEAYEIAAMGAKVLHPPSLHPVKSANIPMAVKYTRMPQHCGTRISNERDLHAPPIKSIQIKHQLSLLSIVSNSTGHSVDFLAEVVAVLKQHGFINSLISSSESNVTLLLDNQTKLITQDVLDDLISDLNSFSHSSLITPCSSVSLVGQGMRSILSQLRSTLELFDTHQIYHLLLASNDLNLTFILEPSGAEKLYPELHALLIEHNPHSYYYSKSWQEEFGDEPQEKTPWWQAARMELLALADTHSPCYVYDSKTLVEKTEELVNLQSIDRLFYALKANPHPELLTLLANQGIGFECASIDEINHVLNLFPEIEPTRLLFTPNFAAKSEYIRALSLGCHLTLDSLYPLEHWPELFVGQSIMLRVDPNYGAGHHKYVRAGGNQSKLGIPKVNLPDVAKLAREHGIKIIGLHTHLGSGIFFPPIWQQTATMLMEESKRFPDVRIINLGGGLGVREKIGQKSLNLQEVDATLLDIKTQHPAVSFWLEPGRFFVAEAGVILAKVTQCKTKGTTHFVGIETGMNSLIRPALYGAHHDMVNLTKLTEPATHFVQVVGPIAEAGDIIGHDCLLPNTEENDVILIANAGAYGHCMSSSYNLRAPAQEIIRASHLRL